MILTPRNIQELKPTTSEFFENAEVIVGVGLHNQDATIRRCLNSIFEQNLSAKKFAVVLLDDNSSDSWKESIDDHLTRPELIVLNKSCNSLIVLTQDLIPEVCAILIDGRYLRLRMRLILGVKF